MNVTAERAVYKGAGPLYPPRGGSVGRVREWVEGFLRGRYGYGGRRAFGVPAVNPLGRRLRKPTVVVLAVAVVAVVLYVLLLYFGLFLPRLPPLIPQPEPLPAEDSITEPTPPSKTLLEPKPDPEGGRGGDGA